MKTAILEVTIIKTMSVEYSNKVSLAKAVEVLTRPDMIYGGTSCGEYDIFSIKPIDTKATVEILK